MHIGVLAKADAHILFTEHPNANAVNPVYEIVLGAGGNSYSEIRRALRKNGIKSVRTTNLLSAIRYTVFWVKISSDGSIEVGREGEDLPFMATKDPNPLNIKYFSLSSWGSSKASWLYDCPDPYGLASDTNSMQVRPIREQLSANLLKNYDTNMIPVVSDERKQINAHHSWIDNRLLWNPDDYNNLTVIKFNARDIWQPPLYLLNAARSSGSDILENSLLEATYKGVVSWNVPVHYQSWCNLGEGITSWPNDKHICEIKLAAWSSHHESPVYFGFSFELTKDHSTTDWLVTSAFARNAMYNVTDITTRATIINLELRRKTNVFNILFRAPFIASLILNMLSLWMKDGLRTSVVCLGALILTPPFAMMVHLAPAHHTHVPILVNLYVLGYFISWIMLMMAVLGSWFRKAPPVHAPPTCLVNFLNYKIIKWLMCLSSIQGDLYENLMSVSKSESSWVTVGNAMDRAVFFTISIALATSFLLL
ncbi:acetylcholine receptor subunit beta-type lev-1-like [Ctenocephalides felis]|uniref:acetylcholine receptor subunit beta-type lev-1-like n=1 Tax=Ctenocephalides felis TaxID=7515 RepID=UPI000E6E24F6|nr:acetylcholine receptor subunit beta-type lev-1-like [Ctenocephalides felis]